MARREFRIRNEEGFNLIRITDFSQEASKYDSCAISVIRKSVEKTIKANGKDCFDLMQLIAVQGSTMELLVDGHNAEEIADSLLSKLEENGIFISDRFEHKPRDSLANQRSRLSRDRLCMELGNLQRIPEKQVNSTR
jgi:phosphotransferase system HPr-like phosphotransfer protein